MTTVTTGEFSVRLAQLSGGNIATPAVEWSCRNSPTCSYAPSSLTNNVCKRSRFDNFTEYAENIPSLDGSACNEIFLVNGQSLFGGGESCNDGCPSIFYR